MATDFDTYGLLTQGVMRFADNANIPNSAANIDWQEYQRWLAAGHTPRPLQPDDTYVWNSGQQKWVQDPNLAAQKNNQGVQSQLDSGDRAAIRSIRSVVNVLARLSPAFPPPATNTDQNYLLNSETTAQSTRKNWQPPATFSLSDAKAQKIEQLRVQGLAYIQIGYIFQTFRWRATLDQVVYTNTLANLVAGNIMIPDSRVHLWDYSGTERTLTPLNAGKLGGALNCWLYLAQQEFWTQVAKVNACTTVADVNAIVWTTRFSSSNPWNADNGFPTTFEDLPEQAPTPDEILNQIFWT